MIMGGVTHDVDNECNARLRIADDYGDNHATMRCTLAPGHEGKHREVYKSLRGGEVTIEWTRDARIPPDEPVTVEDLMNLPDEDE